MKKQDCEQKTDKTSECFQIDRTLYIVNCVRTALQSAVQRQTAVTAYLKSKQLLLFASAVLLTISQQIKCNTAQSEKQEV